jgi:excinuclease ABC subunit A
MKDIIIKGAREHNLKNINVVLPRDKLSVITGLSGSGKSTLAFDTLYAEGQRRYVESLSSYARQFLGVMNKPDVDSIEGLSPAISIEQKSTSKNPRSTVGTITEIYDYLRLLFARVGTPHCPNHKLPIQSQTPEKIANSIIKEYKDTVTILAPIVSQKKGTYEQLFKDLNKEGFTRVYVNKAIYRTDEEIILDRYKKHDIAIVIGKISIEDKSRIHEAVEQALDKGDGLLMVLDKKNNENIYSSKMACPECGLAFEELEPRMFSFNSPFGACEDCNGLGEKSELDPDLIIPDHSKSIMKGAIASYGKMELTWRGQQLEIVGRQFGFDLFTPINELNEKQYEILMYGSDRPLKGKWSNGASMHGNWEGIIPQSDRLYKTTTSDWRRRDFEKYMRTSKCQVCDGNRLKDKILSVTINEKSIIELTDMSIFECLKFIKGVKLTKKQIEIVNQVLKEITSRLSFLMDVGLNYLSLSRKSNSLSGGEAQRIRLATQIGSNLMGVLYVLDEPSIGLHQKDNQKLIQTLHKLRDLGNTLVVVEHDEDTIRNADYVVDIGPGAGIHGGKIIAEGTPRQIESNNKSITGKYLSGKLGIKVPKIRRDHFTNSKIHLFGCSEHNLKDINIEIPSRVMTCITGVSGSGKSTLMQDILYKGVIKSLHGSKSKPGAYKEIRLNDAIDKVIVIDQSPIGRTPRSNPATYIKVFDEIRTLYSQTNEAKMKGYGPGRFSFNVKGGRCEKCQGDGTIKIEMNFLPDVYVECEECHGTRYNSETREIKFKEKSISEVLEMSVEEALKVFSSVPNIERKLQTLVDVGLDYIKVGQSATTLSGGEAQRIKLTRELAKRGTGRTLYLLDEPTTGLHFHDVNKLLEVLQGLVDKGNTMVIIEHNLDVIKSCDHIIDMGPDGGEGGGRVVAKGTPEDVAEVKGSYTGQYLKGVLK